MTTCPFCIEAWSWMLILQTPTYAVIGVIAGDTPSTWVWRQPFTSDRCRYGQCQTCWWVRGGYDSYHPYIYHPAKHFCSTGCDANWDTISHIAYRNIPQIQIPPTNQVHLPAQPYRSSSPHISPRGWIAFPHTRIPAPKLPSTHAHSLSRR